MKKKNLSKKEKRCAFGLLTFFIVALVVGVKSVYAYYYSDATLNSGKMIASYVGDFYNAKGDISIDIYKKFIVDGTTTIYKKVDAVPTSTTVASISCKNPKNNNSAVTCTTTDANCKYTYTSGNFKLTSKTPVNCKVYFN